MIEVRSTSIANALIDSLPREARRRYDSFEDELRRYGCAALAYRLSGDPFDHLCVKHLAGSLRVIVSFESAAVAYVLLIGVHDSRNPTVDVYEQLYEAAGVRPPTETRRSKPPCCDEGTGGPPLAPEAVTSVATELRQLTGAKLRQTKSKTRAGHRGR